MPRAFGTRDREVHPKEITNKFGLPHYNPDLHPDVRLRHVWSKIRQCGEKHNFSEHDYIRTLGFCLSGEPYRTFRVHQENRQSLTQIITAITAVHEPAPSLREKENQVRRFQREPGESLRRAVIRYHDHWEHRRDYLKPHVMEEYLQHHTKRMIKRNISKTVRKALEMEIRTTIGTGQVLKWPDLIDKVETLEAHEEENLKAKTIRIRQKQRKPAKIEIQVNAVDIVQRGLTPELVYIPVTLSDTGNQDPSQGLHLMALHDSGCAQSVIKTNKVRELQSRGYPVQIMPLPRKLDVVTASGTTHTPDGLAQIQMTFNSGTDNEMSYHITAIVYKHLSQDFLLGRDFTGSAYKICETNDTIYFGRHLHHGIQGTPSPTQIKSNQVCRVELTTTPGYQPKYVTNNKPLNIPPKSRIMAACSFQTTGGQPRKPTGERTQYEVLEGQANQARVLPILHTYTSYTDIPIALMNTTDQTIHIPAGQSIAQIQLIDKTSVEIHNIQLEGSNEQVLETILKHNATNTIPAFIKNDQGLTEEEQQEQWAGYKKNGYHYPSMTRTVENNASLTEMSLEKDQPMSDVEFLDSFQISHLPRHIRRTALRMFQKHRGAFSRHPFDLGKAKGIQVKIPINTKTPHIQKYVPVAQGVRVPIRDIIDQYVKHGILRECNEASLFCSNILAVRKKDGSVRFLLDGRLLNESTIRLPTNLITPMEVMAQLSGKKWVTTIDLSDAFYQIELHPESQPYTAFYSEAHGKRYCFTRCPQGLKNSPLHLKLLMDQLFGDMHGSVLHYADDIMIATDGSLDHHMEKLEAVLERLVKGNIKIRPQKVNIARDTVDFLGVTWKQGKLNIPEARTRSFRDIPVPDTPKKLKSVLCALSYYRRFVPKFANLTQDLMAQTTLHPKQFHLTESQKKQFQELIDTICTNTTLYLPDPKKPFYVQTDASQFCGAGKVYQKDEEDNEQLVACISRTFTKTEQNYSTIKKEVLALLYTLRSMDFFLRFASKIVILVDARSILYLRMCKDSAGILLRFSLELSKYNAEIRHVPGVDNEVADVLSRHHKDIANILTEKDNHPTLTEAQTIGWLKKLSIPKDYTFTPEEVADMLEAPSLPNPDTTKTKRPSKTRTGKVEIRNTPPTLNNRKVKLPKEVRRAPGAKLPPGVQHTIPYQRHTIQCHNISYSYQDIKTMTNTITSGSITPQQLKEIQEQDPKCQELEAAQEPPPQFFKSQGVWFYNHDEYGEQLVLPEILLDGLINTGHYTILGAHYSASRIKRDVKQRFFVTPSTLNIRVNKLITNCYLCRINQTGQRDQKLEEIPIIQAPRATWGIDIIPNMPETAEGYCKAVLAVDAFTGYIQVQPLKDKTAKSLITAVDKMIIHPFGIPKILRSDNEISLWNSTEFYNYIQPMGIKFIPSSVASPWSNGHAERGIRTIKEGLRKFLMQEQSMTQWDRHLSLFVQAHNQSVSVYGYAPESLMFGYQKPRPNDLLEIWPKAADPQQYMDNILEKAETQRKITSDRRKAASEKNRTFKNQARVKKEFKRGDIVACRQLQVSTGPNSSLKPKHTGPYAVLQVDRDKLSCIVEDLINGNESREHFTNLLHVPFDPELYRVHSNFADDLHRMAQDIVTEQIQIRPTLKRNLHIPQIFPTTGSQEDAGEGTSQTSQN